MLVSRDFIRCVRLLASSAVLVFFATHARAQNGQPVSFYAAINSPGATCAGLVVDLTGNGKLDLVCGLSVSLGNGDGTFQPYVNYGPSQMYIGGFEVGDFNGDGIPDLTAIGVPYQGYGFVLLVLLGKGDGTFGSPIVTDLPVVPNQTFYTSLVIGDFNGDGKLDVALSGAAVPNSYTVGVAVLLGNGDGTFQTPTIYGTGVNVSDVEAGDLNGDGKLDLITLDNPSGKFSVFLGNGDGTFQSPLITLVGNLEDDYSFLLADFNLDGKLDVAVGNLILLGNGDGTFQAPKSVPTGGGTIAYTADLNHDGIPDLEAFIPAVNPFGQGTAVILLGNGDGTFRQSDSFDGGGPFGDTTGNGILDAIDSYASVTFGNGDGTFRAQPESSSGAASNIVNFVLAADMNGDGKPDVVETFCHQSTIVCDVGVLLGDANGGFAAPVITSLGSSQYSYYPVATAGDFNGDGKMDLAVAKDTNFVVLLGNGDGTFQPAASYYPGMAALAVADVNGDGKPDIVGIDDEGNVDVHLGDGNGKFGPAIVTSLYGFVQLSSIAIADFNHDGKPDVVVGGIPPEFDTGCVCVLLGNGDGTFQAPTAVAPESSGLGVGDFNGDGNPDIVFADQNGVEVLLGNGNGTFQTELTSPATIESISVGDFNGDGKLDVAGFLSPGAVSILLGNGNGTFQPQSVPYGVNLAGLPPDGLDENAAVNLAIADFNGDGTLDVAAGTLNGTIAFLFNRPPGSGATVNPGTLNFGNQGVGTSSSAQAVSLTNIGQSTLSITSISITGSESGQFSQTNTCDGSVSAGKACTISVKFTPSAAGVQTATLLITDNAKGSPQMVTLSGMGASLGLSVASGSSATATVSAGQTAQYKLSIGGMGMSGTATLSCTGAPTGASCSFPAGSSVTVSATQATPFTVSVTTTSRTMARALRDRSLPWPWLWGWTIAGIVLLPGTRKVRARSVRLLPLLLLLFLGACGGGSGSGSGSSSGSQPNPNGTPAGTYHLTVTATSGSVQESMQLTLTVQ